MLYCQLGIGRKNTENYKTESSSVDFEIVILKENRNLLNNSINAKMLQ